VLVVAVRHVGDDVAHRQTGRDVHHLERLAAGDAADEVADVDGDAGRHRELPFARDVDGGEVVVGVLPDVGDAYRRLTPELPLAREVELVGVRALDVRVDGR